ncbi:MAG: Gfo/Idh/MocA family oxidoreductase, partial [Patescibacteria group bacterium]
VFCEKPPGRTVADIKNVIAEEKKHPNLKLKYGFNHRYHQSVIEAKKIIDSKIYGDVINIRGVYGKSRMITSLGGWRAKRKYAGGGILLDQGIHMLDMILYFAGDFPEVKSFISNRHWGHDVEDNAYAIMKNKAGRVAMLHSTATQWQHKFRLEIALQEALVELTGILSGSKSYGEERLMVMRRKDDSMVGSLEGKTVSYLEDNSWKSEVDEFADIIVKNKKVVNGNSADALRAMEMVYRIYRADSNWKKTFNV